jgi:hypothetical protein
VLVLATIRYAKISVHPLLWFGDAEMGYQ